MCVCVCVCVCVCLPGVGGQLKVSGREVLAAAATVVDITAQGGGVLGNLSGGRRERERGEERERGVGSNGRRGKGK